MLLTELKKRQKPKFKNFSEIGISAVLSFYVEEFKYQQEQMAEQTLRTNPCFAKQIK